MKKKYSVTIPFYAYLTVEVEVEAPMWVSGEEWAEVSEDLALEKAYEEARIYTAADGSLAARHGQRLRGDEELLCPHGSAVDIEEMG
jgi:hypothetical protein